MGKSQVRMVFQFLKAIVIELANQWCKFVVPKKVRQYLNLKFFFIEYEDLSLFLIVAYNCLEILVLGELENTLSMEWNLDMKLLGLYSSLI